MERLRHTYTGVQGTASALSSCNGTELWKGRQSKSGQVQEISGAVDLLHPSIIWLRPNYQPTPQNTLLRRSCMSRAQLHAFDYRGRFVCSLRSRHSQLRRLDLTVLQRVLAVLARQGVVLDSIPLVSLSSQKNMAMGTCAQTGESKKLPNAGRDK